MKRLISLLLCLIFIIATFGCAPENGQTAAIATVIITAADGTSLANESCGLPVGRTTAKEAVETVCQALNITYQNKNGLYDGFAGISSTQEDGWLIYFNGKLSDKGLKDIQLDSEGENLIEIKYVNYEEAFKGN